MRFDAIIPLDDLIAAALARVDTDVAAARARYITTTPGQSQVYTDKLAEARQYIAAGLPDYPGVGAIYPYLWAESQALRVPMPDVAQRIVSAAENWALTSAGIEGARVAAKARIRHAADAMSIRAAEIDFAIALADFNAELRGAKPNLSFMPTTPNVE